MKKGVKHKFDPAPYAAFHRSRNAKEEKLINIRIGEARKEARRMAALFAEQAGVERVILFGSLAEGTVRSIDFDIDLAVVGGDEMRAQVIAEKSGFSIDVTDYEDLPPHIQRRIDDYGEKLL
jgi:predicted nucleotidyltransferase